MSTHMLAAVLAVAAIGQTGWATTPIQKEEIDYQNQMFQVWWGIDLEWKLSSLATEGKVPDFRIPYSGHDYPDRAGGVDARQRGKLSPLGKYDTAFHNGRGLAVAHERRDVGAHKNSNAPDTGLFGRRLERLEQLERPIGLFERLRARRSEGWYGHCNGWTAASIRHAEPQKSVVRNGVVFTPADIKGLLAEIYMYSDTEFLGGIDKAINPGTLHVTLANWLGKGDHPVGMDNTVGEQKWNYPIFAYKATVTKHSESQSEVKMDATYALSTRSEMDKSPRLKETVSFHYLLELNKEGEIVGGSYYGDSSRIDMLWTPLQPTQGGKKGNEIGNPHLDLNEVLSIWRDSVPAQLCTKWLNIDPIQPSENGQEEKEEEKKLADNE